MYDPTGLRQAFLEAFEHPVSATSFTCDTLCSLAVPAGYRLEVYQIYLNNTSDSAIEGAYGGS